MWHPVNETGKTCGVAVWNFDGKVDHGLPLTIGDSVHILEEYLGWYRGYCLKKPSVKGIFPTSLVHILQEPADEVGKEEARRRKANEPLIKEVTLVLREWHVIFHERFMTHKMDWFKELRKIMLELIRMRRQIQSGQMTQVQIKEIKSTIMNKVDWGNCRLGLDLVPSVDGEIVDINQCSLVELHKVHSRSSQETRNSSLPLSTTVHPLLSLINLSTENAGQSQLSEPSEAFAHHLHLQLVNFGINTGEAAEAFFALYDAREGIFITERYLAKFNKQGAPHNVEKIGNLVTIFTELSNKDLERDLYLTCHIIRCGQMRQSKSIGPKKTEVNYNYRRPYGYGVLKISHILAMFDEDIREGKEEVMKILSFKSARESDIEKDFAIMHEQLIKNTGRKGTSITTNIGITVKLLMLHGHLEVLKTEKHLLFSKGHTITRKLGFSDIIMPGDLRNDFFISLEKAEFSDKNRARNIEVAVFVVHKQEKLKCICLVDDEEPEDEYRSVIYFHNTTPQWNEILRLNVPMHYFTNTHIRFEFRHCPRDQRREKQMFAMAFMPLMKKDGTAVEDGKHSLYVYKCTNHHDFTQTDHYLKLPYCASDTQVKGHPHGNDILEYSMRDLFEVRTVICSTKLTQNINLLGLLKWRQHPDRLHTILDKLSSVNGEDIVRILQDILDALFSILDERTDEYGRQIFESLVHIISVLGEQRFKSFTTVLDTYIDNHFVSTLAHQFLVHYLMMYIDQASRHRQELITNMLEGLQYLFKFIFRSHKLYKMATGDVHDGDMQDSIRNLFQSINKLMQKDEDRLEDHQLVVLKKFSTICSELMAMAMYTAPEVSQFTADLLDCIPQGLRRRPVLTSKLECIKEAINSTLFKSQMARRVLLQPCLSQLQYHLTDNLAEFCISIIEDILLSLHTLSQTESVDEEITLLMRHLFKEILSMVPSNEPLNDLHVPQRHPRRVSPFKTRCVTCLMEMLRLMKDHHYSQMINEAYGHRYDLLRGILQLFYECVSKDIYSKDWAAMRMVTNKVIQAAIKRFCNDLNSDDMKQVRNKYFELVVGFIIQPALQMETFTSAKQERLKEQFGDMRVEMTKELISKWNSLGLAKALFTKLTRHFLEVTLIPHEKIRTDSLAIIFDILRSEKQETGSFSNLEHDLIDSLDELIVQKNKGDEQYTELFKNILLENISNQPWREEGDLFVDKVTQLLERLIDYRNVCNRTVENRYLKLSCISQLMDFYMNDEGRRNIYTRYVYRLHDLHLRNGDYTEAAHTLLMLARTLEWTDAIMESDGRNIQQTERERKEKMYSMVVELVKKGQVWEYGIPLCKELAVQYESKLFDYKCLSVQLITQAQFFEFIRNQPRQPPTFFRIRFFGSFPILRKHREYIYRGQPFDQPQAVIERFQADFPKAKQWTSKEKPTDLDLLSNEQYIEVRHVNPVPGKHAHLETRTVPANIRYFAENYDINVFSFDRPFHRGERDKTKEFKTLWVERTLVTTAASLPGLLSWSEIIKTEVIEIRPIANAINVMAGKNASMKSQIEEHRTRRNSNINPLSMVLQGTIDAAVQGGAKVYQETFMTEEYLEANPDDQVLVEELKQLMKDQLLILDDGVELHKELAPENLGGFQNNLEKKLAELMKEFGMGIPKVFVKQQSKMTPSPSTTSLGSAPSTPGSYTKTFKRTPTDPNSITPSRATSKFYVSSAESTPSRPGSEGGVTLFRGRATIATATLSAPLISEEVAEVKPTLPSLPPPDSPPPPKPQHHLTTKHVDAKGYIRLSMSRNRSQSVFTLDNTPQKQPTKRKDSLPTILSPISQTAIDEFTTDAPDVATPSSTSSSSSNRASESHSVSSNDDPPPALPPRKGSRPNSSGSEFSSGTPSSRISESPSVSSLMSRISADSQASFAEDRPPLLPPRKASSRPSSAGSGVVDPNRMSSSSSCSGTDISEENAPPVPVRSPTAKDNVPLGVKGTNSVANVHNTPTISEAPPAETRDHIHAPVGGVYTNSPLSASTVKLRHPRGPPAPAGGGGSGGPGGGGPGGGASPIPVPARKPTTNSNLAGSAPTDNASPNNRLSRETPQTPPATILKPSTPPTVPSRPPKKNHPPSPVLAPARNGKVTQHVGAPPVPQRPEKKSRKISQTVDSGGNTNL